MNIENPLKEVTAASPLVNNISLYNTSFRNKDGRDDGLSSLKPDRTLSLNRELTPEQLLRRANKIMGSHRYVHFSLQDGRAVHLSKVDEGIIVHAVHPGVFPNEVRYTNISDRTFIGDPSSDIKTTPITKGAMERTDVILNDLEIFLHERAYRPLIVQVSPQGFHENDIRKLKLGLPDTGGQDKYINDSGHSLTELGYTILNVNRAGPNHPKNEDVREGMHYSYTGMDLLFVPDAIRKSDPRFGQFIAKEEMYPEEDWSDGQPPQDEIFAGMARKLVGHLSTEPQFKNFTLIGHYADGGMVAWHTARIIEDTIRNSADFSEMGHQTPKVWYNAHSLGVLKQRALDESNEPYDPNELRFGVRNRFEQFLYDNVDGVISTSETMTKSMKDDFGRDIDYFLPPGVDTNQFHPRPRGVVRLDERYDDTWSVLSQLSGQPKEVLDAATLVMEVSRTAETKGKIDVLRAFAASLSEDDMRHNGKFLIINIADPNRKGIQDAERRLAQKLHKEVEDLGIGAWVISPNDFPPTTVAQLHQIADIFITGAVSEPWGMSLQQAAASGQVVISTTRVPAGTSVLLGDDPLVERDGQGRPMFQVGEGAIFIEPNDWKAGAEAIKYVLQNPEKAKALAKRAVELVIPKYTWGVMAADFVVNAIGHDIDGSGKVKWSKSKASMDNLTEPCWT